MTHGKGCEDVQQEKFSTRLDVVCLADETPEEVQWLWKPYVPLGKVTLLEGDPESGKSYLSLAVAAHISKGKNLPDYGVPSVANQRARRNVLLLTGRDGMCA